MDLKEIQAWLHLNILDKRQAIKCAEQLLVDGNDTPSLRYLAGLNEASDEDEVKKVLFDLFEEMNLEKILDKRTAGLIISKKVASDILDKKIDPYKGAKKIWNVWNLSGRPKELTPFVNDADDYEDINPKDSKVLENIVCEARRLVS